MLPTAIRRLLRSGKRKNLIKQPASSDLELLSQAYGLWQKEEFSKAYKLCQQALDQPDAPADFYLLKAKILNKIGQHEAALVTIQIYLRIKPQSEEGQALGAILTEALKPAAPLPEPREGRSYHTSLPQAQLKSIQKACHNYMYRGVPMIKNPFDFALYPMLIWQIKPRTLIEIGSKDGGSGLWFGDLWDSFKLEGHIYSLDLIAVEKVKHPRVTFLEGNGRKLGETLTPQFLAACPRPWLIVEDADHATETSRAALDFFHPHLKVGEYIVIEDGIISDLVESADCNVGPHAAIKGFLADHPGKYQIDAQWCDFFGPNLTWCTNGFLRKTAL